MRAPEPHTQHQIDGVLVEKHQIADGEYLIVAAGKYVTKVSFSRVTRWVCGCGEKSRDREAVLVHVVAAHVRVGATDTVTPTYLRLVGQHADPTCQQALHDLPVRVAGI